MLTLRLIHTNDFHHRLNAEGIARLRAVLSDPEAPPTLYLDAGDAVRAGNVGVSLGGEPTLRALGGLGCAAMTLGNREFHVSRPVFAKKIADADFPVLCANLRSKSPGGSVPTVPSVVREVGGVRVGVFGLTAPMVTERMSARHLSDFLFDEPISVAKKLVAELRESAEVVILLSHLGIRADERLAESVEGIDLIVGGHSHVVLTEPKWVNGTPLVQAGCHARWYGEVNLTIKSCGALDLTARLAPLQERTGK